MGMINSSVHIDRRRSAVLGVISLILLDVVVASLFALLLLKGYLPPKDRGTLGIVITIFVAALIAWICLALLEYVVVNIVFWIDIGDVVRYRTLFGMRELAWSRIAVFRLTHDQDNPVLGSADRFLRRAGRVCGSLEIVTTGGLPLEVGIKLSEWDLLVRLQGQVPLSSYLRPVRLTRARALGFIAMGVASVAVGVYANYLVFTGQWTAMFSEFMQSPDEIIGCVAIPILLPSGGVAALCYGLKHLMTGKRDI